MIQNPHATDTALDEPIVARQIDLPDSMGATWSAVDTMAAK
jgi:hypothetical protein